MSVRLDHVSANDEAVRCIEQSQAEKDPFGIVFIEGAAAQALSLRGLIEQLWNVDPRLQVVLCIPAGERGFRGLIRVLGSTDRLLVARTPFEGVELGQLTLALTQKWELQRRVEGRLERLEAQVLARTVDLESINARLHREIVQRQRAEDELRHLAMHDSLTGLPNRTLLHDRLSGAIARSRRSGCPAAVLMVDLDNFKDVNDSYGHAAGDSLLREMAVRISHCVRACDTVARVGGDEFVLVLESLVDAEAATVVADRVLRTCEAQVSVVGHQVRTPPSIGIAVFPNDGTDPETLLKSAELAMYEAKRASSGAYRFYDDRMRESAVRKVQLRERLELALTQNQFTLHYQPLTEVSSGAIVGMEALIRWQSSDGRLVPPLEFIPLAESSGLIVPIGLWVLRTACEQLARWHAAGMPQLSMAVNVSTQQLRTENFHEEVQRAIQDHGIDPSRLEIEITESAAMEDVERARSSLAKIADLGVRIMIDDFGSGYSSLARLKELPIHGLKIDRTFVKHIVEDPRDAAIVTAIVGMAHSLEIEVVAEGIETPEQLAALQNMKARASRSLCDRAQGYLFGKPVPADAATALLDETRGPAVSLRHAAR